MWGSKRVLLNLQCVIFFHPRDTKQKSFLGQPVALRLIMTAQREGTPPLEGIQPRSPWWARPSPPAGDSEGMSGSCGGAGGDLRLTPAVHVIWRKPPNWVIPSLPSSSPPPPSPSSSPFTFWWCVLLPHGTNGIIYVWNITQWEEIYQTQQFSCVDSVLVKTFILISSGDCIWYNPGYKSIGSVW